MTFTTQHEALISVVEIKGVRYIMESQVSKLYPTALDALADVNYDEGFAFYVLNVCKGSIRDVTDEMAKVYLSKFEPDADEKVPEFVRESDEYLDYLEELEK